MQRLEIIDTAERTHLNPQDRCWCLGDYTSHGGFECSETNRQISNLKKKPTASQAELNWKKKAIKYWGDKLAGVIDASAAIGTVTFVPMPGSKPVGHADYDDRMLRVLKRMAAISPGMDVRPLLIQVGEREAQHARKRLTPGELIAQGLQVDATCLSAPLAPTVVVVDDIITMGASFAAAKTLLGGLPGVSEVVGVFLAKTVWPSPFE